MLIWLRENDVPRIEAQIARLVKSVERLGRRGVDDLGVAATAESRRLREALQSLLEDADGEVIAGTAADYRVLSYLQGLEHLDNQEHQDAVFSLFPVALARYVEGGHSNGIGKEDDLLANSLYLLGKEFMKYAQWELATEFFFHSILTSRNRQTARSAGLVSLVAAYNSGDPELYDGLRGQFEDAARADRSIATLLEILHSTLPGSKPRDALAAGIIWKFGTLVGALTLDRVAAALAASGHSHEALVHARTGLDRLPEGPGLAWLRASLLQTCALAVEASAPDEALRYATAAWDESETQRYGNCDQLLREAVWTRYLPARSLALRTAVRLADPMLVAALLERDRLQASVVTTLEYDQPQDSTGFTDPEISITSAPTNAEATLAAPPKSDSSAPQAFFTAMDHAMNAMRLEPPERRAPETGQAPLAASAPWWFGLSRYGSTVYWTLLREGSSVSCGSIDLLKDPGLDELLLDFEEAVGGYSLTLGGTYRDRFRTFDANYHLAEWGTAEERIATSTLGRLIPEALRVELLIASSSNPIRLVIAAGSGFSGIPWPIIQVGKPDQDGFRLVERAQIRHWISERVDDTRRQSADPDDSSLPLLVAIDDPLGDLVGASEFLAANARRYFGARAEPIDDAKTAIRVALHDEVHKEHRGLFYYRGHASSDGNAASSALDVPNAVQSDDEDDNVIRAGEFFGRFEDDHPLFPLPSRVVLSCCSSATTSLFGGEAIGLAAACILGGGAKEVIATGCDVDDTPFTTAFDDILASVMVDPRPHDELLRGLQIRMYDEWRLFSVRGGIDTDNVNFPHPMVWAMYLAI